MTEHARAPASAAYYVVQFAPREQRARLSAWLDWFSELDQMARKLSDPGVARLKLDWWRDEIQQMRDGQARHPLAQSLQTFVTNDEQATQMQRAIDALEVALIARQPSDIAEFETQCRNRYESRLHLLCDDASQALAALSHLLGVTTYLRDLSRDLRRGHKHLPTKLLGLADCGLEHLEEHGASAQLVEGLKRRYAQIDLKALHRQARLRPALRLAAHQMAQLKQLAKTPLNAEPAPLRTLWSAWQLRN